jgi:hypothetical protein
MIFVLAKIVILDTNIVQVSADYFDTGTGRRNQVGLGEIRLAGNQNVNTIINDVSGMLRAKVDEDNQGGQGCAANDIMWGVG